MFRTLLIPLDGSLLAEQVLPMAVSLVRHGAGRLILARVLPPASNIVDEQFDQASRTAHSYLQDCKRRLDALFGRLSERAAYGSEVSVRILLGSPQQAIADFALHHQVDLILMSTNGRSGRNGWAIGKVAEHEREHHATTATNACPT